MIIDLPDLVKLTTFLFVVLSIRYLMVSGLLYWCLWIRRPITWENRRLQDINPAKAKITSEIKWSLLSCAIFALPTAIIMKMTELGYTKIYLNPGDYGWVYLPVSLLIYLFLHDTYFYWTHRWLHLPKAYRYFHRVHHQSINTTPWTSFSFHQGESIIQAMIIPILVFLIPVHLGVLSVVLLLMTIFGVVNHTGYEVYPRSWMTGWWHQHWITPTHHTLHHHKFNCNYGLYFRLWDKLMKTDIMYDQLESPTHTSK